MMEYRVKPPLALIYPPGIAKAKPMLDCFRAFEETYVMRQ